MKDFLYRTARSRWFRSFFGVAVVSVLIWLLGPLLGLGELHPLHTEVARAIVIVAIVAAWLVLNVIQELRARRRDAELAAGAAAPDAAVKETEKASAEEVALLSERLRAALLALRKAKLGGSRKRLASLPWYMFIGPPGAGKTTALLNCGLKFPLAHASGGHALPGVGGTRNCDWWFTEQAVLIDTAGRYTTQDSQSEVDAAGWLGFLQLLKRHRGRQPLNGVLVAISLSDLSLLPEDERLAHARAIRRRVRELHDELGVRVPAYVLFTKADLVEGFAEFFDGMGKEEREQVWGVTFPLDDGNDEGGAVAGFRAEFDALLARLNDRMLERVHGEPDIRRRRLIYGFPQQVASLRDVAADFLTECFGPSRIEARPLLRGVYLTSGTQHGTPIDRLLGTMTAQFGLARPQAAASGGAGRGYFLSRLMRDVVFGEAALVGADPRLERRARWTGIAAWSAAGLLLVALGGSWMRSYVGNTALIAEVHAASAAYDTLYADLTKRGPADTDLPATLPALDTLRGIRGGYAQHDAAIPVSLTFGLYQGSKLGAAAADAYVAALSRILLPRLLARMEGQIAAQMDNPDVLYQALKAYLILGRQGPLDRELISQWYQADLLATYPSEEETPLREVLLGHIDAMLRQPLIPVPLSAVLVQQARAALTKQPLAEYSYNRLLRSKRVQAIPAWSIAENGGPGAGRVFQMRSGAAIDAGLPGVYTWAGYHNVFLPLLPGVTQDVAEDAWVLGREKRDVAGTIRDTAKLRRDVLGLYLDDYARRWDAMLADIAIKPFNTLQQGLDQLSLLSAPASPLRDLLTSIDAQTQLSRPAATDAAMAAAEQRAARVGQRAAGFAAFEARSGLSLKQNELLGILSEAFGADPAGKVIDPAKRVDEHFRALHDFVAGADGRSSPMEASLQRIQAMYQGFNQAANAGNSGQALLSTVGAGGGSAAAQLQDLTRDMPPPVAAMLQSVSRSGAQVTASGAGQELSNAWSSKVAPLCEAAFKRYPFLPGSSADVPADDFTGLLGPGGTLEKFFDQYLKPFVDTTQHPWRWQSAERAPLGLSAGSLVEFERAAQIRDALFPGGGPMQVRFQLVLASLDPLLAKVGVEIGGQSLAFAPGAAEPAQVTWPGPGGKTLVRVTLTPTAGGAATTIERDGPWALLRLLDAAKVTPSGQPDKLRAAFAGAGGTATFDLNASSVRNPFTMAALRSFRCPVRL